MLSNIKSLFLFAFVCLREQPERPRTTRYGANATYLMGMDLCRIFFRDLAEKKAGFRSRSFRGANSPNNPEQPVTGQMRHD
jgi:ribosomal protein S14